MSVRLRSAIALWIAAGVITGLIAVAAPALAINGGTWRSGANSTITFDQVALTTRFHTAFHDVDVQVESSDITTSLFHDSATTYEVEVFDFDYNSPIWHGIWECHAWSGQVNGRDVCTQGHVHIDLIGPPGGSFDDVEAQSLMCEEVGHAVSLAHSQEAGSCMSQNWALQNYTGHDIAWMNVVY